jgi:Ca2+-transporting ATPase
LVVVSVPEGLPLAVVLALSFATRKMMEQNLLVRVLASCETMGNATVIATDKTGTLTKADMQVVAGSIGVNCKFVQRLHENKNRSNANTPGDFSIDMADLGSVIPASLQELISESIAVNSTAFEEVDKQTGEITYVGSKTETGLLKFSASLGWPGCSEIRHAADVIRMIPFSSEQKCMACIIRLPDGRQRLMLKGASEILTKVCTSHIKVSRVDENETCKDSPVETVPFNEQTRDNISRSIVFYANQSLRTIALCYRDFPAEADLAGTDLDELARDLSLVMIVGIEDPLREGVIEAVANCQKASIRVVMVTGDNVLTATSIAKQCGILTSGGLIMEGPSFRGVSTCPKPTGSRVGLIIRLRAAASRSSPITSA